MTLRTNQLTRQQIGQFIGSERGVRAFEDAQADITDQFSQLSNSTFLTLGPEPILGSERVLAPVPGELIAEDGGANGLYRLGLPNVIAPGTYGDDTTYPVIQIDAKGRIVSVSTRTAASGGGGSGTVTDVSVITANGVSGSVAASTTTPAITLTLGAITPSSVAATGTVTGSNLSGTNTGDQTTITGNAGTATALQTGRTISISGKVVAAGGTFDGTSDLTLNVTSVSLVAGDIPTIAQAQVTGLVTDLAAKQPLDAQLTDLAGLSYTGNGLKVVRVNAGETGWELATPSGGGSAISGMATITVPNGSLEWEETVAATGVTGTSHMFLTLAPADDTDENDPLMLDVASLSAAPGVNQMTVAMAFRVPAAGAIKINWSAI